MAEGKSRETIESKGFAAQRPLFELAETTLMLGSFTCNFRLFSSFLNCFLLFLSTFEAFSCHLVVALTTDMLHYPVPATFGIRLTAC